MPAAMEAMLKMAGEYDPARFAIRTVVVVVWLAAGWCIVHRLFKNPMLLKDERVSA
jgi:hypothetical protein